MGRDGFSPTSSLRRRPEGRDRVVSRRKQQRAYVWCPAPVRLWSVPAHISKHTHTNTRAHTHTHTDPSNICSSSSPDLKSVVAHARYYFFISVAHQSDTLIVGNIIHRPDTLKACQKTKGDNIFAKNVSSYAHTGTVLETDHKKGLPYLTKRNQLIESSSSIMLQELSICGHSLKYSIMLVWIIKPTNNKPTSLSEWRKIVSEIMYVMEQLTHRLRVQAEQCEEKWVKWTLFKCQWQVDVWKLYMSQDHFVESMQSSMFMVVKFFVFVLFSVCVFVYFSVPLYLWKKCPKKTPHLCQVFIK